MGPLEVGKRADIAVIDRDPSRTASDIERVLLVFKNGVGYDTQKLFTAMHDTVGLH